jgi:hypothetical protein
MAGIHKLRVVHVSLEMSEFKVAQRYYQTMYGMGKRNEPMQFPKFKRDELGTSLQGLMMVHACT